MQLILGIISFMFGVGIVCFGFWADGFDFSERGSAALMCYIMSIMVGTVMATITIGFYNIQKDIDERS